MRIIEVIIEAADPIRVNATVGNHLEDPIIGEEDNKTITEANTKAAMDNRGGNDFRSHGHGRGNY